MLRRSANSSGTTIITYPFGIEEHQYSGSGSNQWNIYYYFLAGHLLGSRDGNGTQFYLSDALGSLVSSFNNSQGGASMKSNQLFGPYGNNRYNAGSINTAKGFTGQYNDSLTGLDYYNARYYDPVAGVFLSADTAQGNASGESPYSYVNGNPETYSDPTGLCGILCVIGGVVEAGIAGSELGPGDFLVMLGTGVVLTLAATTPSSMPYQQPTTQTSASSSTSSPSGTQISPGKPTAYWNAVTAFWLAWLAAHQPHTNTGTGNGSNTSTTSTTGTESGAIDVTVSPPARTNSKNEVNASVDVIVGSSGEILAHAEGSNGTADPNNRGCAEYFACKKIDWDQVKALLKQLGTDNAKILVRVLSGDGRLPCVNCWNELVALGKSLSVPVTVAIFRDTFSSIYSSEYFFCC